MVTCIGFWRNLLEELVGVVVKALLCVEEEKAETAGRITVEVEIVKSITVVMRRIDASEGKKIQRRLLRRKQKVGLSVV
jgi:hypothetical protein